MSFSVGPSHGVCGVLSSWGIWREIYLPDVPASRVAGLAFSVSLVVHSSPKAHTFRQISLSSHHIAFPLSQVFLSHCLTRAYVLQGTATQ